MRYVTVGCYCTSVMCLWPLRERMTRLSSWQCSAVQRGADPQPRAPPSIPLRVALAVRHDGILLFIHHTRRWHLHAQHRLTPEPASQPESNNVPNRPGQPVCVVRRPSQNPALDDEASSP